MTTKTPTKPAKKPSKTPAPVSGIFCGECCDKFGKLSPIRVRSDCVENASIAIRTVMGRLWPNRETFLMSVTFLFALDK